MAIKINDIPPEGLSLKLAEKLELLDQGSSTTIVTALLTIKPEGGGLFTVAGTMQAELELECSRCLKKFAHRVESQLNVSLVPEGSLNLTAEHELDPGELDTEFYQGDEIDPLDFVKEQALLSIPMTPLHRADCKGLCALCGADLNEAECGCSRDLEKETSPFSVLKDKFKK